VFDVGIQTANAIQNLMRGVPAFEAGGTGEYAQGNGSLMRVLPLALWHRGSDAALVQDAHNQSRVTHAHIIVQACCALYCLWARRILENHTNPWAAALESLKAIYAAQPEYLYALETGILGKQNAPTRGTGYVIDCLFSAKWALEQGDFETVVKAAISLGHDTDTTACVAGGIAGIRDGINAIPERWRSSLRGQVDLEPLLNTLIRIRC
jgi:ADP-ribosylglycohydrolase